MLSLVAVLNSLVVIDIATNTLLKIVQIFIAVRKKICTGLAKTKFNIASALR